MLPNKDLKFSHLCKKDLGLLLIFGARRKHAITTITIHYATMHENKVVLLPSKILQHSAPNHPLKPFVYYKNQNNEKLCIAHYLHFYLAERHHNKYKIWKSIITHAKNIEMLQETKCVDE